jgi:hypothetical protein
MPIVLPPLPEPSRGETGPYVVIARHRALAGRADAYEQRMLADLAQTRAEPGALQFHIHRDDYRRCAYHRRASARPQVRGRSKTATGENLTCGQSSMRKTTRHRANS